MTRRRIVYTGAALILAPIGAAVVLGLFLHWRAQFPVRAFERIAIGMGRDEVAAAIGLPPGSYARPLPGLPEYLDVIRSEKIRELGDTAVSGGSVAFIPTRHESWCWDDFWIATTLDDGKVVGAALYAIPNPPTLFERLRRLLGL